MDIEQVRDYTLSLLGVTEDQPFGDDVITYRIEGKIFLCLSLGGGQHDMRDSEPRLALKLTPERNEELREQYSSVTPAWHWNKKHWSDVYYEMCITSNWKMISLKQSSKSHTTLLFPSYPSQSD